MSDVERTLARHAAGLRDRSLAEPVRHAARRCIIDWFAATVPGAAGAPALALRAALDEELGHGPASLIADGARATTRAAALINGTAAHTVEFDDIYRPGVYHPGAPVIAAALAMAQRCAASGDALLRGVVAGYETSNRVAAALMPSHYRFWHTTGTAGTLGAAIGAAVTAGLDEDAIHHALGNAATMAAGLQQAFRSDAMTKPLHSGHAAGSGVLCALAAGHGFSGAQAMLSGPCGLGAAMSEGADWPRVLADLDAHFTITEMTQKNHGCCGHTFAAIDAVLALRAAHAPSAAAVHSIEVASYQAALDVTGNWQPTTPYEAKFSLPFVVATALQYGAVRLDAFSEARLTDPALRALMGRVSLTVDADMQASFPTRRAARVTLRLADGTVLAHLAPTRKGDPDAPLSDAELEHKFRELAAPVLGATESERLLAALWQLDQAPDCSVLLPVGALRSAAE